MNREESGSSNLMSEEKTEGALQQAAEDMAAIARGEELELPWRRLRILFDHSLVEVLRNVVQGGAHRGSTTSLGWTAEGARFMSARACS